MGGYINLAVGQDYIRTLWYVWTQTYFGHPFSEISSNISFSNIYCKNLKALNFKLEGSEKYDNKMELI